MESGADMATKMERALEAVVEESQENEEVSKILHFSNLCECALGV